jgi:hypothetical protein
MYFTPARGDIRERLRLRMIAAQGAEPKHVGDGRATADAEKGW